MNTSQPFSKLRSIFFPIHRYELKKVLPMAFIFFFILFNYTCLRNVKDALILSSLGAETIPFLKAFCVPIAAIVFMIVYTQASDLLSNEKLFYWTLTPFIVFFGLFGFVLYPIQDLIHPSKETIEMLNTQYGSLDLYFFSINVTEFYGMYSKWSYSLFYILAEIWGSAILSLSFWQFANQICKTSEAKRFYAFFSFIGQASVLATGSLGAYFSNMRGKVGADVDPWGISLYWLMGMVVIGGFLTMFIYRWIYTKILTDKRFYDKPELPGVSKNKKKKKPSITESFKTILTSPYLGLVTILVIAYGTSINFIEALWKKQIELQFLNANDINIFMNKCTIATGFGAMIMLIIGGNILRLFSWFTAAVVTPTVMFIGGSLFFTFILLSAHFTGLLEKLEITPQFAAILLGAGIVIVTKSTKYALFDLTKEMSYIPLDEELKIKGKAAVDVVGGRFGKASGAQIQALLLAIAPMGSSFINIAPTISIIFVIVCIFWVFAVKALSKRVEAARRIQHDSV